MINHLLVLVLNFANHNLLDGFRCRQLVAFCLFGGKQFTVKVLTYQIQVSIGSTFRGCPDGKLKALDETVSEFTGPHNILGSQHRHNAASQRHKIGITSDLNRLCGGRSLRMRNIPSTDPALDCKPSLNWAPEPSGRLGKCTCKRSYPRLCSHRIFHQLQNLAFTYLLIFF